MIEDFRYTAGPRTFAADLCIIGAGPAGITIACEFANTPWRVCLLESGGLHSERASQALNDGQSVGPCMLDPAVSRVRAFGGSARLWGGGCIPLGSGEIAQRDWVPDSGWPLDWAALAPYYLRASHACRIDAGEVEDGSFLPPPSLAQRAPPTANLDDRIHRASPLNYGHDHLDLLRAAPNVQMVLHANLLRLEATANGSVVRRAAIGTIEGRRGHVDARCFVLAAGGIENARVLLLSNDVAPAGLGNDHDLVGRYFMDHPRCRIGSLRAGELERLVNGYGRPLEHSAAPAHRQISVSPQAQRTHHLLNARAWPFAIERAAPAGLQSLRSLRAALRQRPLADEESRHLENELVEALSFDLPNRPAPAVATSRRRLALHTALHAGGVVQAGFRKLASGKSVKTERVDLVGYFEQSPNRDSRISLSGQRDALDLHQVRVDWRLNELDTASIRATAGMIGNDMATHFHSDFAPADWLQAAGATPRVHGTAHHLGTTRMSDSATTGVVDRQCRVHGIDNLYIAGSSTFPTGGWAFPTLTIVALALRIADELRARLGELSVLASL